MPCDDISHLHGRGYHSMATLWWGWVFPTSAYYWCTCGLVRTCEYLYCIVYMNILFCRSLSSTASSCGISLCSLLVSWHCLICLCTWVVAVCKGVFWRRPPVILLYSIYACVHCFLLLAFILLCLCLWFCHCVLYRSVNHRGTWGYLVYSHFEVLGWALTAVLYQLRHHS